MVALLFSLACIALAFGLGGIYLAGKPGPAAVANLLLAAGLFIAAALTSAASIRRRRVGLARSVWSRALVHAVVAVVLAGAVMVLASRLEYTWDVTKKRSYTLTEYTRQVLEELPVEVEALYAAGPMSRQRELLLLETYDRASEHFRLRVVSPQELSPQAARQIARGGSRLVLHVGPRARKVPAVTERYITRTLLDFCYRSETGVCFLTGHGEPPIRGGREEGLDLFRDSLEAEGFRTSELMLATREAVPDECSIVVVAAPERPLLKAEKNRLERFFSEGGRILAFLEPDRPPEPAGIIEQTGIFLPEAIVVDEDASLVGSPVKGTELLVTRFSAYHPVTHGLGNQTGVVFSGARPLIIRTANPKGFVFSNRTSRLEAPVQEARTGAAGFALPPGMNRTTGMFVLGASVEQSAQNGLQARLVVFGDVDLATNRLISVLYNEDLVINSVYYLANRGDRIKIRPKAEDLYQVPLIPERTFAAFHSVALLIPEVILVLGLLLWYRRRQL